MVDSCMYVCMYEYIYVCTGGSACGFAGKCLFPKRHVYIHTYICIYIHTCVLVYTLLYSMLEVLLRCGMSQ